jgi:hypothetical protein
LASQLLVIHERIATWARALRPRLQGWPVRIVETRSAADLQAALAGAVFPVVVIDLARGPRAGLDELDRALRVAPDALTLVLDPEEHEGVLLLSREIGATDVIAGPTTPPLVADLLARWLQLARHRAEAAGWSGNAPEPPEPEPWNWLTPLLNSWAGAARPAGN